MLKIGFAQVNYNIGPKSTNSYFLPYSVGVLISYLKQYVEFNVVDILFKRDLIDVAVEKLAGADIIAFSTYVWNKEYNYALAKKIKELYPNTLLVFGGPEVPISDFEIFKKHPYIDLVVENEGEIAFLNIVEQYHNRDFKNIPGLLINQRGLPLRSLQGPKRIDDIDSIPSPYLTGVFDDLVKNNPDVSWNITIETNRGCPYACTFCDWGSLTYNKVKKFNLQRVFDEIEWVGKNQHKFFYLADANFGIFPERDESIMDKVFETKNIYGSPTGVVMNWAKDQKVVITSIAKKLIENNFDHGLTVSLQSLSDNVLDIIKRRNLEINKANELFNICREIGIPVHTELILGLPGETLSSWKQNFYKLFRMGHKTIAVYQCQTLENSELNTCQVVEHDIKTVLAANSFQNASNDEEIYERLPIVISTKDMPTADMALASVWSWVFYTFHINGLTNFVSEYCERENVLPFEEFYEQLFELINSDEVLAQELRIKQEQVTNWLSTGDGQSEYVFGTRLEGLRLFNYGTTYKIHLDTELKNRVQLIVRNYVFSLLGDNKLTRDLLAFQEKYLIDLYNAHSYPIVDKFSHDWIDYFVHKLPIEQTVTDISFHCNLSEEMEKLETIKLVEYIWYKRRVNFGMACIKRANDHIIPFNL